MIFSLENYLFLSKWIPLPLSAIKFIEKDESHPFHNIMDIKKTQIIEELKKLNKQSEISINKLIVKASKIENLIKENIFEKLQENIKRWIANRIQIVTYFDDNYPVRLKTIKNPPKILFARGNYDLITKDAISIIGTRNPTEYGRNMAFKIGLRFTELGFVVINGFAKGVDIEAIKGSLKVGGKIIGILGSGLLNPYPKENVEIFFEVINKGNGLFLSENLPNDPVKKSTLATRNRISSALSIGNMFIEGSAKSGIRYQLKYGKEQKKPIVVLKPKKDNPNAAIPNQIITEEKHCYIIKSIDDIPLIAEKLIEINKKKEKSSSINSQRKLSDFKY